MEKIELIVPPGCSLGTRDSGKYIITCTVGSVSCSHTWIVSCNDVGTKTFTTQAFDKLGASSDPVNIDIEYLPVDAEFILIGKDDGTPLANPCSSSLSTKYQGGKVGSGRRWFVECDDFEPTGAVRDDSVLFLTRAFDDTWGALDYEVDLDAENFDNIEIEATFKFWTGFGTGADATWLYLFDKEVPKKEDEAHDGYHIVFDEHNSKGDGGEIQIHYDDDEKTVDKLSSIAGGQSEDIDDETWKHVKITLTKQGGIVTIRYCYMDYGCRIFTDYTVRDLTGTHFGFAARTGSDNNYHIVDDLLVKVTKS